MKPGYWKKTFVNIYITDDEENNEESVCSCIPDPQTSVGCEKHCINSVTNIECDVSSCPCGEGCRNQKFSNYDYSDVEVRLTEHKGTWCEASMMSSLLFIFYFF